MFHLQTLELLHWDYCRRVQLPLDAAIVTIAGPNGSGKTTLLDALRTLLGLECSGGRSYKTYARHSNAHQVWLRATVDNRPQGRQSSSRPFASSLLHADQVTLACKVERVNGDWQRRYVLADGDRSIEQLLASTEKDVQWLGVEAWRRRLAAAGLTPAIARVLSLEQGQTDRLCEFSPKELLKLVFDVFGDQDVLDRYEQARGHQQQLVKEVALAEQELGHTRTQLAELALRVNNWKQRQLKVKERERLATEVVPVLEWAEAREAVARSGRELHRQRLHLAGERQRQGQAREALLGLHHEQQAAAERVRTLEAAREEAQAHLTAARDAERPVEATVKREQELLAVAGANHDAAQLTQRLQQYRARIAVLQDRVITQKLTISDLRHKYHALARSFNEAVALSDTDSSDSEDTDSDLEDLDEDPAALGDLAHLLDDEDEDEDDDGKENGRSRASSLSSHPGDPAHKTAQGAGEDEWEAYIKNPLDRSPRHGDVDPVEGKDEDDILQALQELAAEKQQQRLLRAQRKQAIAAEKQRQEELAQDKASERRASRKKQKELERQDMQSFSKAVLAGDFASMGKCLLSRLPSATSPLTSDERPPRDLRLQRRRFRPNRRPKGTPPVLAATRPCPRHCPPSC